MQGRKKLNVLAVKHGKANKLCDYCNGTGKVRCQSCDGKGRVYVGTKL